MKDKIAKNVKAVISGCLEDDGLLDTIKLSYNDLDYGLEDIFTPLIKDPHSDDEYDQLHDEAEAIARSVFNETRRQLRIAHATIMSALSI